jgi:sugar phosphate isomerase/epimerase
VKHPELRSKVVERLKVIGAQAEKAGVIIGVETELDAEAQIQLLDEIGSPAIKVYYNFANAIQNNRNLIKELLRLGKDRICQIHCTNQDGVLLQDDPRINMQNVKAALDSMGWSGWLVIERSRDASKSRDVKGNFGANTAYLKSIFQKP